MALLPTMKTAQADGQSTNVLPLPRWILIVHAIQLLLAVIVLGLAAYGVSLIAYYALIYSIVCCLLTFPICGYILGTTLFAPKMYNGMIVFVLHCFMALFWLINMGLTANLARVWGNILDTCYSTFSGTTVYTACVSDYLDIDGKSLRGTLIAGALFAAAELVLWVGSGGLVMMHLNKRRNESSGSVPASTEHGTKYESVPLQQQASQNGIPPHPGQYSQQPSHAGPGGPYEQNQQYQYMPAQQPQYTQPYGPYTQQSQPSAPYAQDPINRGSTVSPVSQSTYSAPAHNTSELATASYTAHQGSNVSELSSPHTGPGYNPNVSELSNHR